MADGEWGGAAQVHPLAVKIQWTTGTQTQMTGFHLRAATANIADAEEAADQVLTWVTEHYRTHLRTDQRISLIDVVDLTRKEGFALSPANLFGTISQVLDTWTPAFVATTVTLKSSKRTREGQGRMFWPLVVDAMTNGDTLNPVTVAQFQASIDALATAFIGNSVTGYNLVNVHDVIPERPGRNGGPPVPARPRRWFDVTTIRLNTNPTSLRSRKATVGS